MRFTNDYWHSLDKETANRYSLNPNTIGISTPPFKDQLESLKTRIFQGASQVELGFTGRGKSSASQGSISPEQISQEEREQIRLLAKINKVELSTHNTVGVGTLSGFDARRNSFDNEEREASLNELKRTVDFAADVTQGGPIVVHTGEFPRPIYKYEQEGFQGYPMEKEHAPVYLADPETGQVLSLRRDIKILEPVWKNKENEAARIPERDENNNIKFKERKYQEVEEEFKSEKAKAEQAGGQELEKFQKKYKDDPGIYFYDMYAQREILQNKGEAERMMGWAEQAIREGNNTPAAQRQAANLRNTGLSYAQRAADQENQLARIKPIQDYGVEKSADAMARGAIYAMKKQKETEEAENTKFKSPLFIAPENIFPENGYGSHPEELKNMIVKSREEMQRLLWDKEKNKPTKDGSELGVYSYDDAVKSSQDHIKATFDIGHLNTWRKFFTGKPQEFNEWVGKQVETLAKEKIIGHAHITDNFGFYDEHVTPGEGNAPIAGFIKKLKENEFKGKIIVEPGHQDVKAWTGAMRSFNSPIYRVDGRPVSWTEVEHSYFSKTRSPTYLVGETSPGVGLGEEYNDWRFWSRLPIE